VAVKPMVSEAAPVGRLVLVHDMSFITRRSEETKRYVFYFFMGLAAVISLITVIIAQLSWRGWMTGMRALLRGEGLLRQPGAGAQPNLPGFKPIARDLQRLISELEAETRTRDEEQITWTPESLRAILHGELRGEDIIVVSNREPYIHQRRDNRIEVQRPASGLSRHWNRSCAPARARGSRMAAARLTARWSTSTTASRCRRKNPPTRYAASG